MNQRMIWADFYLLKSARELVVDSINF